MGVGRYKDRERDRLGDKFLESKRVGAYQKDRNAMVKGLRAMVEMEERMKEEGWGDEEIKKALRLTKEECQFFHDLGMGKVAGATLGTRLAALRLLMEASVEKPKQKVEADVGVEVVVNTYRRGYEVGEGTSSTVVLPGKVEGDAE